MGLAWISICQVHAVDENRCLRWHLPDVSSLWDPEQRFSSLEIPSRAFGSAMVAVEGVLRVSSNLCVFCSRWLAKVVSRLGLFALHGPCFVRRSMSTKIQASVIRSHAYSSWDSGSTARGLAFKKGLRRVQPRQVPAVQLEKVWSNFRLACMKDQNRVHYQVWHNGFSYLVVGWLRSVVRLAQIVTM